MAFNGDMRKQVLALIDTATELISYEITGGTQAYLGQAKSGKKALNEYKVKEKDKSKGWCYKYVKIALTQANIVEGVLADEPKATFAEQESASHAGDPLLRKGFKDVTDELPDARWAAAGDVIVYTWTDKTWERRKKSSPNKPNHGHIDIRSYESYISDFIPPVELKRPTWTNYTNIRIYRKVFDPLPTARMRAFLHCLRDYECQAEPDDSKRYNMLNTPLPGNSGQKRFDSYRTHPWATVPPDQRGTATAAGAYQFVYSTWKEMFDKEIVSVKSGADLFSPQVQDRLAVCKLESRNALDVIRLGNIEAAIKLLEKEWTSLPGAKENAHRRTADGKPMDMSHFLGLFNTYLAQEKVKEKIQ